MHKLTAIFFISMLVRASAIVVQDYTTAETAPVGLDWSYVYNYRGSSAVAVDPYWILTAKHVADSGWANSFSGDGTVYLPQEVVYHASADLALVRVDKDLSGFYGLYTGYIPQRLTDPKLFVLMVGYGTTGSTFSDYWTDSGSGRNIRRWGSQEIDTSDDSYKSSGADSKVFLMYFDLADTAYEAGAGFGDSGGGVFYKEGAEWKLAGINIAIAANASGFDRTFAAAVPQYADWIQSVIPEPEVINLMSLSAMGLLAARRLNRRKQRVATRLLKPGRIYLCDSYGAMAGVVEKDETDRFIDRLLDRLEKLQSGCGFFAGIGRRWIQSINDFLLDCIHASQMRFRAKKAGMTCRAGPVRKDLLDGFLDRVHWDRWVSCLQSMHVKVVSAIRVRSIKYLDSFLEKAGWDQKAAGYRRLKKRFASGLNFKAK